MSTARGFFVIALAAAAAGCYGMRGSEGGGQTEPQTRRTIAAADVQLPAGYVIEVVASGFTFPTGVAFDAQGVPHVVESGYSYGEVWTTPRLLKIENGAKTELAHGERNGPWSGVAFHDGAFFVAEGGQGEGGRILRIENGATRALVENLPSLGDHHTNGPAVGPDGRIYFGQGTATNSGVVGTDNALFGWLKRHPEFHDIPCKDITLTGHNYASADPLSGKDAASTGAYSAFGKTTKAGQVVRGRVPCSGAVMSVAPRGGSVRLVAWGFRNPFGLAFNRDGQLYVTDNGYDDRGSRPVWGAGDLLWAVKSGAWYGWPDYSGHRALNVPHFTPPGKDPPGKDEVKLLLAKAPGKPPQPAAVLGVHSSSNGFDFSRNAAFGHVGEAFIAQFGDQAPATGKTLAPVGFKVIRVDASTGRIEDFAVNRGEQNGPASNIGGGGLERPVAARFNPAGDALYVVDFGIMRMDSHGAKPQAGTGVLWRIRRTAQ